MRSLLGLIKRVTTRSVNVEKKDIEYQIGNYLIFLPQNHKLPEYQAAFRNYDKKLRSIVQIVESKNQSGVIIDIGANIGDTAAYIRSFSKSKIYCIEGDFFYLEYLKKNCQIIPNIEIVDSYIAGRNPFGNFHVQRSNGTAKLDHSNEVENNDQLRMITLQNMINKYGIMAKHIELIKIDTDGFDLDILLANKEYITIHKPNLYFEYDISFNEKDKFDSIEVVSLLESAGYSFVVYDNFGNLLTVVHENAIGVFTRLNHYLFSSREKGGGIYYLDVFASTSKRIVELIEERDNLD